jgi:hypothetical protein
MMGSDLGEAPAHATAKTSILTGSTTESPFCLSFYKIDRAMREENLRKLGKAPV